ncbi:MAG: hypothetical protein M0011_05615, partial [Elusimicrobia bacterium]|nr:hypothetical protein [Elusimicrobiota bacterium]
SAALAVSPGWRFQFGDVGAVHLAAELRHERFARFGGLDETSAGLSAGFRRKFGLGPYAPWARTYASAALSSRRDSALDGVRYLAGLEAGRRLSAPLELTAAFEYDRLDASRSAVFDVRGWTARARAEYRLPGGAGLYLGLASRRGTAVFYEEYGAPPGKPAKWVSLFGERRAAYRARAAGASASLGGWLPVGERASVSAGLERRWSRSGSPAETYREGVLRAGVSYGF